LLSWLLLSFLLWRAASCTSFIPVVSLAEKLPARIGTILFDTAFVVFNLLWYWLASYGAVKLIGQWKPWDDC